MSRSTACEESNYYETMSQIKCEADTDAKKNGRQNSEEAMDFSNKKKQVIVYVILTVVVDLQVLSLVAVFVLAGYSHSHDKELREANISLSQQLSSLEQETYRLKIDLNKTIRRNQVEIENYLQSLINTLTTTTTDQYSSLQSSVDTLTTAQNSTDTQVSSLQSTVSNLTSQLNTPVDLHQGCIQETSSCTMSMGGYLDSCQTSVINTTVGPIQSSMMYVVHNDPYLLQDTLYHTVDRRCEYTSVWHFILSATLRKNGDSYRCQCDVTRLEYMGPNHYPLPSSFTTAASVM